MRLILFPHQDTLNTRAGRDWINLLTALFVVRGTRFKVLKTWNFYDE